jgi:acetolactate synthase I/II/III large subunit
MVKSLFASFSLNEVECVFGCEEEAFFHKNVRYVQLKHEQSAVHAADGFARATGKPGVVLLTSAVGSTNAVTGIATAYSDSVPIGPYSRATCRNSIQSIFF